MLDNNHDWSSFFLSLYMYIYLPLSFLESICKFYATKPVSSSLALFLIADRFLHKATGDVRVLDSLEVQIHPWGRHCSLVPES